MESVFLRQNKASLEAGQLLDDADISPRDRLALKTAERKMLALCNALNRVVQQKMARNDPSFLLEIEVKNTIGECDFATRDLERLIATQE